VSTALVGLRNTTELEDNVGALGWELSAEELAEIDAAFARHDVDPTPDYWIEDA
jgi:aryl-alcohol dehydrogenase-like predicted oxidoreductase